MWKTIPGFSKYEVSTKGDVRHRKYLRILKKSVPTNGYLQVNIYNDKIKRSITKCIHQLMALTFLGEKPLDCEIDHINKVKTNNKLSNLRYIHWTKNRFYDETNPLNICIVCGEKTKNKLYCSRKCQWSYSRILVKCTYCGKLFYRRKSYLAVTKKQPRYTNKQIFCSLRCVGFYNRKIF